MKKAESPLLISIVVPVYNREFTLKQTLQSFFRQIHRPIELILVDNRSEDQSLEICMDFKRKNETESFRVEVLQEPKKGANAARNTGAAKASGDYVVFFDSDDRMYPECLSTVAEQLTINDLPDALAYPFVLRRQNGKQSVYPNRFSANAADQLFDTILSTHNVCIKRTVLQHIGPWDETLQRWQDLEFGFRTLLHLDRLAWYTARPLYEVIRHGQSISDNSYFTDHEIMYASLLKIEESIRKQLDGRNKQRLLRALAYKTCTIASQLRKEGHPETGNLYLKKAQAFLPESGKRWATLLLNLQYGYESRGGRGLWRIARILL